MYGLGVLAAAALMLPSVANAQFRPRAVRTTAVGDDYHLEIAANLWSPSADMTLSSSTAALAGSTINLKSDLGLQDTRVGDFRLTLKGGKHKFRAELTPIKYTQTATLKTPLTFAGQTYPAGSSVTSTIDWKAWRFGYEYDFARSTRGFMGAIVDVKYTDVGATLTSGATTRSVQPSAPIPAVGLILRINPASHVALTGELTGFKLPGSWIKSASGSYLDIDAYATVNVVNAFGVQLGYRKFDLKYTLSDDNGTFKLEGPYVGAALRF